MSDEELDLAPNDAELISRVRGGDVAAYGTLFARHVDAANRLAHQLVPGSDADDLVSESFVKVLNVLLAGGGPDIAFRAYLLTAVRRLHIDKIRATQRATPTDDLTPYDDGVPFADTAVSGFEDGAAAKAFRSLPERWQLVLWHLEVEGQKPADIAPLLGMSANSVSALAYRAREGLRQAFLNMHINDLVEEDCRWTHAHLGAFVRNGLSRRDSGKVSEHLKACRACTAIYLELTEVNSSLAALLGPIVLGAAATGYLATTGTATGAAAASGVVGILGHAKSLIAANAQAVGATAAAAVVAVAAGGFLAVHHNRLANSDANASISRQAKADGDGDATINPDTGLPTIPPAATPDSTKAPTTGRTTDPAVTGLPTGSPTVDPTTGAPLVGSPSADPTHSLVGSPTTPSSDPTTSSPPPTKDPTQGPTGDPSQGPTQGPTTPATPSTDTAVSASVVRSMLGLTPQVTAIVSGVPDGQTTTMRVRVADATFSKASGSACKPVKSGYNCTVGSGSSITFHLINVVSGASVSFDVDTPTGYDDPNSNNNTASVTTRSLLRQQ